LAGTVTSAAIARNGLAWQATLTPEPDEHNEVAGVIAGLSDIDADPTQVTHAGLRLVVERVTEGIMITDATGRIIYANPAFERISGYTRDELLGRTPAVFKSGHHDLAFYSDMWSTITTGRTWSGRVVNRRKDGSPYEIAMTVLPFTDRNGGVNYVGLVHDVSAAQSFEARQAAEMEAIGRLAGGVAHDFNNLLTVINGYGGMLLADLDPADPRREHVEEILRAADQAAALARDLLAFSRRQILKPRLVDLSAIIADNRAMLEATLGEAITLDIRSEHGLGTVSVDPEHLVQVILNLALNARDAMPSGGTLTIETRNVVTDARLAVTGRADHRSKYVLLSVCDTGVGLTEEARMHLFEPFFTTKGQGKGTGLGLATVYGFVKQSGGYIAVDSASGAGTCFNIYFPQVAGEAERGLPARRSVGRAPVPRTVLLVEDEPAVLAAAQMALVREGYRVLTASSAEEALTLSAGHRGRIDLLITDVVMPGLNGVDLAERLVNERPELAVLLISGYADRVLNQRGVATTAHPLLRKPFAPGDLLGSVGEVLEGSGR